MWPYYRTAKVIVDRDVGYGLGGKQDNKSHAKSTDHNAKMPARKHPALIRARKTGRRTDAESCHDLNR